MKNVPVLVTEMYSTSTENSYDYVISRQRRLHHILKTNTCFTNSIDVQ